MEAKYKSLSMDDFQKRFPDNESCLVYLAKKKWKSGFKCHRCGHNRYCKGDKNHIRQCTSCRYKESPTANTLFHKVKFSLYKAFTIVYYVSTNKKGISSTELSRKLQIGQKTCWLFRQKVLKAMESKNNFGLSGNIEVTDFVLGRKKVVKQGKVKYVKRRVILGIEKKGRGISHVYANGIETRSFREIRKYMKKYVLSNSVIKCYQWSGYDKLELFYEKVIRVKKSESELALSKRMEKSLVDWLKGMHHDVDLLQNYLNEFCYRFNRNQMKEEIFDHLLDRMINHGPWRYKDIIA